MTDESVAELIDPLFWNMPLEDRMARGRQSLGEMEKARGDLVGELRQMSIQVERSREKLARCRTEREANAAQREVEELRKLYRDREIELEKLDGLIQQGRGEFDQVTEQHGAVAGELGTSESDSMSRIATAYSRTCLNPLKM